MEDREVPSPQEFASSYADSFLKAVEPEIDRLHPENGSVLLVDPRTSEKWRKDHFDTPTIPLLGIFYGWDIYGGKDEIEDLRENYDEIKDTECPSEDYASAVSKWLKGLEYPTAADREEHERVLGVLEELCLSNDGSIEINDYSIKGTEIYLERYGLGELPDGVDQVVIYKFLRGGRKRTKNDDNPLFGSWSPEGIPVE